MTAAGCQFSHHFGLNQTFFLLVHLKHRICQHILTSPFLDFPFFFFFLAVFVQPLSHVQLFVTPWTAAHQAYQTFTISQSLLRFISSQLVMLSNHLILCCPLLLSPSIFTSIRVFSNKSALHTRWPKYWHFSISPSNEYSELISFRIDWFDLLAVQERLKSLLQHNLKASVLWCSTFFLVQLSHLYMTTGKTTASIIWIICQPSDVSAF